MRIIATAGHVDHGKSTLVRALTGMEPDRLAEERARGLTIDLGFAWADLRVDQSTRTVAFVDVPGHERFLSNMVAGAAVVAEVLLVVAADEGWSAQSTEHLEVLDLLGVRGVAVAVTKAGRVDGQRAHEVVADVRRRLAATSLAGTPVVVTDAVEGTGMDELVAEVVARTSEPVTTVPSGRGRLWVDRSFVVDGAGTVVTGSWWGDDLAVGDEVVVLPGDRRARVRGLQSLGRPVEVASRGSRLAINLAGPAHDEVTRGDVVARPHVPWRSTSAVSTAVRVLPGREVGRRGAWHLHVGTADVEVRVEPLLQGVITPGEVGLARLELSTALPLCTGDRMVLRESGRRETVAGVTVLDPEPGPPARGADARLQRVDRLGPLVDLGRADDAGVVRTLLDLHDGIRSPGSIAAALGREPAAVLAAAGADTTVVGPVLVATDQATAWTAVVVAAVEAVPATAGLELADAVSALADTSCPPERRRDVVDRAVTTGALERHGTVLVLPNDRTAHRDRLERERRRRHDAIVAALLAEPFAPPDADVLAGDRHDLRALVDVGRVVRVHGVVFAAAAIDHAIATLATTELADRPFTAAEARTAWATTRKYALPLLEHLAATGHTTFDGTHHRLVDRHRPLEADGP